MVYPIDFEELADIVEELKSRGFEKIRIKAKGDKLFLILKSRKLINPVVWKTYPQENSKVEVSTALSFEVSAYMTSKEYYYEIELRKSIYPMRY